MRMRVLVASCVAALLMTFTALAADVAGTWTGEQEGRNGPMTVTFNFKTEGNTLTGAMTTPRGEAQISEGKVNGDEVSFVIVREFNGNSMKINYSGTVSGNEMKLKTSREGSDRTRELTLKRSTT